MIYHLLISVVIGFINTPQCYSDENVSEKHYEYKKRTVMIAILVRNKEHTLPYFLTYLERLDYPKERISLWISSDNNIDKSAEVLKSWLEDNGRYYHGYKAVLDEESRGYEGEKGVADWTPQRYQHVIQLREAAITAAKAQWADYIWMLDSDTFLVNPQTLNELINQGHAVSAPMLLSDGLYSNFWGGMTETFYYKRTDEYLEILNRKKRGCFPVPMIHAAVLVDLRTIESESLTYDPLKIPDYNGPKDDVISFAISASKAGVPLMICNSKLFGFITISMEKDDDLSYDLEQLRNLKLEALNFGPGLNTTEKLSVWVKYPPPPSKELELHQIYVINLLRREERRIRMKACLQELNIAAEFYPAFDARDLTDDDLLKLNIKFMPTYQDPYHKRPMKKGEIGCFLSHYYIWKQIVDERPSQPVLVLEDDVRFEPFFRDKLTTVLKEAARLNFKWDLIYLGRKIMNEDKEQEVGKLGILVHAGYSYWTIGYLISYQGAHKLISAKPLENLVPVDEYIPILSDKHPRTDWKEYFADRDLIVLSTQPFLIYPVKYSNEEGYISDTEDSLIVNQDSQRDEL